jgi:hypothetical protein
MGTNNMEGLHQEKVLNEPGSLYLSLKVAMVEIVISRGVRYFGGNKY